MTWRSIARDVGAGTVGYISGGVGGAMSGIELARYVDNKVNRYILELTH